MADPGAADARPPESCRVVIVGGGPAGLALAAELKRLGIDQVVLLEREVEAGGVPRHCGHYPFGILEYGRLLKGPAYARRNVDAARAVGVALHTGTTVTRLLPGGRLACSTSDGIADLQAERVVLCTGVREASRAQRFIGGDRPAGVLSTGALQALVYLEGRRPFRRPVILGSELVSFSVIGTCRHLGMNPVAMIEEEARIVARPVFRPYLTLAGVPLITAAGSPEILGRDQVEAVRFTDAACRIREIAADGVIVSGRFRPEAALLHGSHLEVDPGTGGPVVDQFGRCSDPAYYAAGNLLRPAETAGWCWREGRQAARRIAADLAGRASTSSEPRAIRLRPADPAIGFALPQRLTLFEGPGAEGQGAMTHLQLGLARPARGVLMATSGDTRIVLGSVHARPVRRVLLPLRPLLQDRPRTDLDLTLDRGDA